MEEKLFFGPYEIIGKIAEGAFSEIFQVKKGEKVLVLKKLKPYMMYDREYIPLIKNEALLLSKIKDDLHFPIIYDQGEINKESFSVMEFIDGFNLEEVIETSFRQKAPLPLHLCCQIVLEICLGLEQLHKMDLNLDNPTVHGDLRASNVMVSREGEVKLIDLGLKGGTFDYKPLERLHENILTPYTDLYAVGHILYELIYGKRLYKADTKLDTYFEMRKIEIKEEIFKRVESTEVRKILTKCLRQEPSFHYKVVGELRRDLEAYLDAQNGSADRESLGEIMGKLYQIRKTEFDEYNK